MTAVDTDGDSIVEGQYTYDESTNNLVITELFEGDTYTYNYNVLLTANSLELESAKVDLFSQDQTTDEEIEVLFTILGLLQDVDESELVAQIDPNAQNAFITFKFAK